MYKLGKGRARLAVTAVLLLGILSTLSVGCAAPTVKMEDVLLRKLSMDRLEIGLVLDMFNPNEYALPLETIDWDLSLFQNRFADGVAKFGRQIPAKRSSKIDVPIGVRFADAAMGIQKVVSSRTIPWNVGGAVNFRLPAGGGPMSVGYQNAGSWKNPLLN